MSQEVIYVKPQRHNIPTYEATWEGQRYRAAFHWWSKLTGTTTACMCARRKQVREGRRNYTTEQILGIDEIDFNPAENLPAIKSYTLQEIHAKKREGCLTTKFLRGEMK